MRAMGRVIERVRKESIGEAAGEEEEADQEVALLVGEGVDEADYHAEDGEDDWDGLVERPESQSVPVPGRGRGEMFYFICLLYIYLFVLEWNRGAAGRSGGAST